MTGAWRVFVAFAGVAGLFAAWFVALIVVPGVVALYIARLFPLVGRWRGFRGGKKRG